MKDKKRAMGRGLGAILVPKAKVILIPLQIPEQNNW
jgi:hypothetical protein